MNLVNVVSDLRKRLIAGQAVYYVVTGIWPVIHLRSFEAVTGPKADDWLVHMVGLLAAVIGITLGAAVLSDQTRGTVASTLAITSASAFAAIDLWYGLSGQISAIYLGDAAVQVGLISLLLLTREREAA
jgi:hypothetical protein